MPRTPMNDAADRSITSPASRASIRCSSTSRSTAALDEDNSPVTRTTRIPAPPTVTATRACS